MDEYEQDVNQENIGEDDSDLWTGEEEILVAGVPEALWSDNSLDETPPKPEQWVEELADKVEVSRLLDMGVLKKLDEYEGEVTGHLTTRFVRDWRQKLYIGNGDSRMRWMRRSRYVAREFATEKRDDVFAPTTGAHSNNLLLVSFLQMADAAKNQGQSYKPTLASMDIGDAFLQVDQEHPVRCELQGCQYVILKNLPGQRLGARSWYLYFKDYLQQNFNFEFSDVQPCLGRTKNGVILIHVDEVLYTGDAEFFEKELLPVCQKRFSVKWKALDSNGSAITFLRRKITMVSEGLMVVPGTQVMKVVENFENHFGKVRGQLIPCDSSIQLQDVSKELGQADAAVFRSIVGMCLYLSRDRPDISFTVKEVSGKMSRPTLTSLQHLKKLIGYLKKTGDLGILLKYPEPGKGNWRTCLEKHWILESYSDADWASNKAHRKSTSCGVHLLNGCFLFSSSRTQRVISLSSCESELYSIVSTMSDAIFIRRCLEFILDVDIAQVHFTDSSSARQLCSRQGVGKIRHLSGKVLWVQSKVQSEEVELIQMPTAYNIADIGTKSLSRKRLFALMGELGMVEAETGQPIGQEELEELRSSHTNSRDVSKLAKTILRLTTVLGLGPTGSHAQDQCETPQQPDRSNEMMWIWFAILLLAVAWIGLAVVAYKFWKEMDRRMQHNELQQAETDTLQGHQQNMLDGQQGDFRQYQRDLSQLESRYNNYTRQTDRELAMMEDYIDSVRDGLVCYGGFTRYDTLTREQRSSMEAQERANRTLFRARQTIPEDTDASGNGGGAATSSRPEPTAPAAPTEVQDYLMEDAEEEEPADDVVTEVDPTSREGELVDIIHHLRGQVNQALAHGHFDDAADIQTTLTTVLDSSHTNQRLTSELARQVIGVYQRLYRRSRNRGNMVLAEMYQNFASNMNSMFRSG